MNKTKISATIVADSLSPQGDRLTSLLVTFPRIILAEVNTHRMLSKNTSSSRAIPFEKMVEAVQNDPFIPIAWQKHHSGMQGNEYITDQKIIDFKKGVWINNMYKAVKGAEELYYPVSQARSMTDIKEIPDTGVTKQLCNRLLEPFMWTTMLITGSKEGWDNFFKLRCPQYEHTNWVTQDNYGKAQYSKSKKDYVTIETGGHYHEDLKEKQFADYNWLQINRGQAEIHIMDLAEKIYDAMNESKPTQLKSGEWHIPFGENINNDGGKFVRFMMDSTKNRQLHTYLDGTGEVDMTKVKVSIAMAARTSYTVVGDEKEINYENMIGLHDKLINQDPPHSSPMEHCARAMTNDEYTTFIKGECTKAMLEEDHIIAPVLTEGWCRNFKGFIQYRHIIESGLKI